MSKIKNRKKRSRVNRKISSRSSTKQRPKLVSKGTKGHDEHREYKEYAIGGGDYVRVYKPINPIEEIVGGKVKFIQRRR